MSLFCLFLMSLAQAQSLPVNIERLEQDLRESEYRPKVLIFVASIGFGHINASNAVIQGYEGRYPEAEIIVKDIKDFLPPWQNRSSNISYDILTKYFPSLYDYLFESHLRQAETLSSMGDYSMVDLYRPEAIYDFIQQESPDLIISTFNHASEALIRIKNQHHLNIPMAQILTDYVDHLYFKRLGEELGMSFVPSHKIRDKWIREFQMNPHQVAVSGIPVAPYVHGPLTQDQISMAREELGLRSDIDTVLLVSGSAGVGNFKKIVESLIDARSQGSPLQIIAVTARNERHFRTLNRLKESLPEHITLSVQGLVPHQTLINYMKSSDLIITKSGGLSVTEILHIDVPAILLDINGGQESYNSRFFEESGMAWTTRDQGQVGILANDILEMPLIREGMIRSRQIQRNLLSSSSILDWAIRTHHKRFKGCGSTFSHLL